MRFGKTSEVLLSMKADRVGPLPRLRAECCNVSPSLEAIVRKCLASNPADRYATAADLCYDLARQRTNQLSRHVREPSPRERLTKLARRHPKLSSPAALGTYAATVLLVISAIVVQSSLSDRSARQDEERLAAYRKFEDFLALSEGVKQAAGSPSGSADVLRLGNEALARFDGASSDWEGRPQVERLPAADRVRLKAEIGELAFLTARAAALSKWDAELAVRLNAIAASSLEGADRTVVTAQLADIQGRNFGELPAIDGGRGSFLHGCDLAARGRHADALPLADAVVAKNPDDFGGWFLKARCHDTLGQYQDARAAYATCAALRPLSACTYTARGELAFRHGPRSGPGRSRPRLANGT